MAALRLLRRVWVEGPAKAVLIVLADHANDDFWSSFPSQETIAFEAGVSRRTVQRALAKLQAEGLVEIEGRSGTQYGRASNITYLIREGLEERASLSPVAQRLEALRRSRGVAPSEPWRQTDLAGRAAGRPSDAWKPRK